jgi:phosphate transport system substrate-binding protein
MTNLLFSKRALFFTGLSAAFATSSQAQQISVTGAGATFPAPLYFKWADEARRAIGVQVNYQSIGSGAGINQIKARTVHFGATDAPLEDLGNLYQFPTVEGQVVPVFNLPGITDLTLTMPVVVKIYQGQITMWNDKQIADLNPKLNLPRMPIVPIYRADGSGTTFIWTRGMRDSNAGWTDVGTSVRWPTGQGARGNEGVAATVQRVRGSLGYVEYIYSKNNNIPMASMDYPSGKTFILLPKEPRDRTAHNAAVRFFEWCLTDGRSIAESMHYRNISTDDAKLIISQLKSI